MKKKRVTPKQRKAIDAFIVGRDKTAAYRSAYCCDNMKKTTVYRKAFALFEQPHVAALCITAIERVTEHAQIDAAWVLKRAALLADFNIKSFIRLNDNGEATYDFSTATEDDWYCISEYTVDQIGKNTGDDLILVDRVKLKVFDKLAALKLVGQHIDVQAFKERVEHSGEVTQVVMTAQEYKQARKEMMSNDDC